MKALAAAAAAAVAVAAGVGGASSSPGLFGFAATSSCLREHGFTISSSAPWPSFDAHRGFYGHRPLGFRVSGDDRVAVHGSAGATCPLFVSVPPGARAPKPTGSVDVRFAGHLPASYRLALPRGCASVFDVWAQTDVPTAALRISLIRG